MAPDQSAVARTSQWCSASPVVVVALAVSCSFVSDSVSGENKDGIGAKTAAVTTAS